MGKTCTFIGDNFIPDEITFDFPLIHIVSDLVENRGVDTFYFSQSNWYQKTCLKLVALCKKDHPNIKTILVADCLTMLMWRKNRDMYDEIILTNKDIRPAHFMDFMFHHKWAIDKSDIVVVYTTHKTYILKNYIEKSSKEVIKPRKCYRIGQRLFENE